MATLSSHSSYYSSKSRRDYQLKATVAKADGTLAHYNLFSFLLKASLIGADRENKTQTILHDCRAGNSLLFLFPPNMQAVLSLMFYQRELEIQADLSNYYTIQSNILLPQEVLAIHSSITEQPLSPTLLYVLSQNIDRMVLKELLTLNPRADIFNTSLTVGTRLENLFTSYNYSPDFLTDLIEICSSNNRLRAAVYIAQRLGYTVQDTQNIVSIVELWLVEN